MDEASVSRVLTSVQAVDRRLQLLFKSRGSVEVGVETDFAVAAAINDELGHFPGNGATMDRESSKLSDSLQSHPLNRPYKVELAVYERTCPLKKFIALGVKDGVKEDLEVAAWLRFLCRWQPFHQELFFSAQCIGLLRFLTISFWRGLFFVILDPCELLEKSRLER